VTRESSNSSYCGDKIDCPMFSAFKRGYRPKRTFRRSGPSTLGSQAFAAFVGVISGYYIFAAPLKEHFEEEQRLKREREQQ